MMKRQVIHVMSLGLGTDPKERSMMIDVRTVHLDMTDAIRQHAEDRFVGALHRFDRFVRSLSVRLVDLNGPRGGMDKACRVMVTLRDSTQIVIEQIGTDLYAAMDQAAGRAKQALGRKVDRLPKSHRRDRTPAAGW